MFPKLAILLTNLVICCAVGKEAWAAPTDPTQQLQENALPKWRAARQELGRLAGSVEETVSNTGKGFSRRITYCLKAPLSKFEITSIPDSGGSSAYVHNATERFEVDRNGAKLPSFVADYGTKEQDADANGGTHFDLAIGYYLRLAYAGLYVDEIDICQFLEAGKMHVTSLSEPDPDGRVTGEVTFTFPSGDTARYRVVFLSHLDWLVSEWSAPYSWGEDHGRIEYFPDEVGGRYPSMLVNSSVDKSGVPVVRKIYNFARPTACTADDRTFTLAHYGLTPSDTGTGAMRHSGRRWAILLFNILIVMVLVFLIARRRLWSSR